MKTNCFPTLCVAATLAFSMNLGRAAEYEWTFSQGNLSPALGNGVMDYADDTTPGLTSFGATDGTTVPHIAGQSASYLNVPAFTDTANGYTVALTDSGPNGGGAFINQYTFIFDVLIPGPLDWTPFFNTAPGNNNDADFYVDSSGALGIGEIGYAPAGTVQPDTWHRITFAADLGAGTVTYYVDGNSVYSGNAGLDGRFSLYSNQDPAPHLLLFNEGDTSGVYTHEVLVNSVYITDRMMSSGEVLALGGPQALGIIVPEPGVFSLLGIGLALVGGTLIARRKRD